MNENELPETVKALNEWVNAHFTVLTGPQRAFLTFPFHTSVGYEDEQVYATTQHRIIFVSLAFLGSEDKCCRCIAAHLYTTITREAFLDADELLFVRRYFTLEESAFGDRSYVIGRLGFWDTKKNKDLISRPCFKPEGGLASKAVMPVNWFERM
jgi:hypothetical protein